MALDILEYPDNVRIRPGYWIGSTENCSIMFKELIDNAVDEYLSGRASKIYIDVTEISEGVNRFIVADNSTKGFSLNEAKRMDGGLTDRTEMDAAINMLSSSTKFKKTASAIGLNGVGSAVCNALSEKYVSISNLKKSSTFNKDHLPKRLKDIYKDQKYYYLEYKNGVKVKEEFVNELSEEFDSVKDYTTIAMFIPDLTILLTSAYELPRGLDYVLKDASLTGRDLTVYVNDEVYVSKLQDYKYLFDIKIKGLEHSKNPHIRLYGSFQLSSDLFDAKDYGAVNTMACHQGRHIQMFRQAYKNAIKELYGDCKGQEGMGMHSYVFLTANEVDFDSQSKSKLSRITEFDESNLYMLKDAIKKIMKENDEEFSSHYQKILNFLSKKGDLNRKQQINHALGMDVNDNSARNQRRSQSFKPLKLKDAWSENRKECELLLFEGDSAKGGAMRTRDPKTQAIFPLRGVPVNTSNLTILEVLKHVEMRDLFRGIGAGVDGNFNLKKCRYGKIIYCGDEDEDGRRIAALVIGTFGCHAKFMIENGMIYILRTPFYIQNGKYIYAEDADKELDLKKPFKRVKGLGGLGKDYGPCVTDKNKRRLVQVTWKDAEEAIQILRNGNKKKELLTKTGVVSNELWVEEDK